MDVRAAVAVWLRQARESYGGDLPVAAPGELSTPGLSRAEPTPAIAPSPENLRPDDVAPTSAGPSPSPMEGTSAPQPDHPTASPAASLAALCAEASDCTRCKLAKQRKQVVFGEGDPQARVMFIGEAPGFHEDQQGRPFVGAAGQLLDKIIANAMGLRRSDTYIANINKCRPPDNREPEPDEVAACIPFLRSQVRIIRPAVIVCLGRVASANLLGTSLPMRALRGRDLSYEGTPVVVTWHPAYLLRNPDAKRETWDDIKRVNRLLGLPEVPVRP